MYTDAHMHVSKNTLTATISIAKIQDSFFKVGVALIVDSVGTELKGRIEREKKKTEVLFTICTSSKALWLECPPEIDRLCPAKS